MTLEAYLLFGSEGLFASNRIPRNNPHNLECISAIVKDGKSDASYFGSSYVSWMLPGPAAGYPTLMRMRELEVLEKIYANGNLKVFVGEKGLDDRVVNLL